MSKQLKITVVDAIRKPRKAKPIDWDNASDRRLLAIAMNGKDTARVERAVEILVEREFHFTPKQARRLLSVGAISADSIS